MQAQISDWRKDLLEAGADALDARGAVVLRLTTDGPEIVSRVYSAADYRDTQTLRRVAIRRATQLLNQDTGGWAYYVAIRYSAEHVVIWTGMHSILIDSEDLS